MCACYSTKVFADDCGPKFMKRCKCEMGLYDGQQRYIINCTNSNFRDTDMLAELPLQAEVLIFTGNNIRELPWNVFGTNDNLTNLEIIDLSLNNIHEIRGKAFHRVAKVRRLILNHNNLSISRNEEEVNFLHPRVFSNFINLIELHLTNAFADNLFTQFSEDLHEIFVNSNLTKLRKLHLEQNEITKFNDKRVFCDLPNLMDLHLGDNLLKELNFNINCLKKLRFLDLERNKFEFFRQRDINTLEELERSRKKINLTVDFSNNPFTCDCAIFPFQKWLGNTSVEVRNLDKLSCFKDNQKFCISDLVLNKCKISSQKKSIVSSHRAIFIFLLIVLSCILLALLVALLYISKDKIKTVVSPALSQVTKKVQYTSIKDDDTPEQFV